MRVHTLITWVSDLLLSEVYVTKGFFVSILLTEILLVSIFISYFSFLFFAVGVPVAVLVGLDFVFCSNSLPSQVLSLEVVCDHSCS